MSVDVDKLSVGQGLILDGVFTPVGQKSFSLIVGCLDDGVDVIPVKYVTPFSLMYDCSDRPVDQHNVLLRDCPPPFSNSSKSRVFAVADIDNSIFVPFCDFNQYHALISDDYSVISDSDLFTVFHHDKEQLESEFRRLYPKRELPFDDVYVERGEEFGFV